MQYYDKEGFVSIAVGDISKSRPLPSSHAFKCMLILAAIVVRLEQRAQSEKAVLGDGLESFVVAALVDEEILLPFGARFGVVAQKHVVKAEAKQLLGGQERHACLVGCSIAFALIALNARCHKILRRMLAALCTRQDVIERQVFRVAMLTAILTAVAVTNVDPCTLHRILVFLSAQMDIVAQAHNGRHRERRGWRMQNVLAVVLLNKHGSAKPQADGARDTDRPQRFIRKVQ